MKTLKKGIALWDKAKKIIPGGTQLLSKRSEMFLPDQWPSYFQKAKGIHITDLDGNTFIDMSIMGVGSCILGYADPDVNKSVKKVIDQGSMGTLNSPEEVELAELLLELHPWAGMARFTRSGGEAMAVAVRIARAHTKKDTIAFCGYHGWHDWYLAANLADKKNLDGQLLPGLEPLGVPRALKGSAIPFNYNKIEELEKIIKANNIGIIVVEPAREREPQNDFLKNIERIAKKIGAVLIFDEITSGWRMNLGGIYELYNVTPDIVVYAKAISNGFPMGAIIGKKEVMDAAQESFISSTSWTERVGSTAALATIKKLKKYNVPRHLIKIGGLITKGWQELGRKHDLQIETMGIASLPTFSFKHEQGQALHTLFVQEMLKRGYLASKSVYVSYAHTLRVISAYLENIDDVFAMLKEAAEKNTIEKSLNGPIAHKGFERLT